MLRTPLPGRLPSIFLNTHQRNRYSLCIISRRHFQCRSAMQQPHLGIQSDEQGRTSIIDPSKHEDLPTLCQRLHARVNAFITAEAPAKGFLKTTQEQTRVSLRVIEEALDRYRFVRSSPYDLHIYPGEMRLDDAD